jgi:hypothetical protein
MPVTSPRTSPDARFALCKGWAMRPAFLFARNLVRLPLLPLQLLAGLSRLLFH